MCAFFSDAQAAIGFSHVLSDGASGSCFRVPLLGVLLLCAMWEVCAISYYGAFESQAVPTFCAGDSSSFLAFAFWRQNCAGLNWFASLLRFGLFEKMVGLCLGFAMISKKNVCLAHHWLVGMRGGERVLEQICSVFPDAPIYTLFSDVSQLDDSIRKHRILPSVLNRIPGAKRLHQYMLPLYPFGVRSLRLPASCDLLVSTDASVVKGIFKSPSVPHICYCHSPPRYLWDMTDVYSDQMSWIKRVAFRLTVPWVRRFDEKAAARVDHFIANSQFVADRIRRFYGREATVIYPPVGVEQFDYRRPREDFYLVVAQLVPYKRVDLAVEAFTKLGKRLIVIGDGSERDGMEAKSGKNVQFLGRQPFHVLKDHYERCRAFLFPGIEDFGITALEAQAAGSPVIAIREGGSLETVVEGRTGVFFEKQTCDSLADAVTRFENDRSRFSATECRANAEKYTNEIFRTRFCQFLETTLDDAPLHR